MTTAARLAQSGDEKSINKFLNEHADTSLYIRSFLASGGLVDRGAPLQGTYALALDGETVLGVAVFNWQGGIFLQADDHAGALTRILVAAIDRPLVGLLGPPSQVEAAHLALGRPATTKRTTEGLFALDMAQRIKPTRDAKGAAAIRNAEPRDLLYLREWRFGYERESTGMPDTDETRAFATANIDGHVERGEAFVLEVDGAPVATNTITARVDETIQIGGVYVPPALRGKGYGRRVVDGTLDWGERNGATRAILFTDNPVAERSYAALGFRRAGDYAIWIVKSDIARGIVASSK